MPERFKIDHVEVAQRVEQLVLVEHVGHAAAHAGSEIAPGAPQHDDHAAGGSQLADQVVQGLPAVYSAADAVTRRAHCFINQGRPN